MPDISGWRVHVPGTDAGLVLAVDFPINGRNEAGFAALATRFDPTYGLWETLPSMTTEGDVSGAAEVARWLPAVREDGRRVVAISSFCAGAAFVDALADPIEAWQGFRPELVLVDPELPVPLTLYVQFQRALERFRPIFAAEEMDVFAAAAQRSYDECDGNIDRLLAEVSGQFRAIAAEGFPRVGIDLKHGAGLTDAFEWFSRYLVAGSQLKTQAHWPGATALTSRTPSNGLNRIDDESLRARCVEREIRIDIEHAVLLDDPLAAQLFSSLIAQTAPV